MIGNAEDEALGREIGGRRAAAFQSLQPGPELDRVLSLAAQASFRRVAILPAFLIIVFGAIWLYDRSKGGYQRQNI